MLVIVNVANVVGVELETETMGEPEKGLDTVDRGEDFGPDSFAGRGLLPMADSWLAGMQVTSMDWMSCLF